MTTKTQTKGKKNPITHFLSLLVENRKPLIVAAAAMIIWFGFGDLIAELSDYYVVNKVTSHFKLSIGPEIFALLILVIFTIFLLKLAIGNKYIFSKKQALLLFVAWFLVFWIIWGTDKWSFTQSQLFESQHFTYISIFFVFLCSWAMVMIVSWAYLQYQIIYKDNAPHKSYLREDTPIEHSEFGRKKLADELCNQILGLKNEHSFSIGIQGSWGSGKSSFMNSVKAQLKEIGGSQFIEVDFKPFYCANSTGIIKEFFSILEEKVAPHIDLGNRLRKYSNALIKPFQENALAALYNEITLQREESDIALYEDLDNKFALLNKKIIVYIDDVDRLGKDEIIEVFRLIRNSANFNNFVFVVAFDREYVEKTLNDFDIKRYISKFIQLEINLPIFSDKIIATEIIERLKSDGIVEENDINQITYSIAAFKELPHFINNHRDVIRLVNNFNVLYRISKTNILATDFFLLELLKHKHPIVFEKLFLYREEVFIHKEMKFIYHPDIMAKFLSQHCKLSEEGQKPILQLTSVLFGISLNKYSDSENLGINNTNNFLYYFSNSLCNEGIEYQDFQASIESGHFKVDAETWLMKKNFSETFFQHCSFYLYSWNYYEKITTILFELIQEKTNISSKILDGLQNMMFKSDYGYELERLEHHFSNLYKNNVSYQSTKPAFILGETIISLGTYRPTFEKEFLQKTILIFFENYLLAHKTVDQDIFNIFFHCIDEHLGQRKVRPLKQAVKLMRERIEEMPETYFRIAIEDRDLFKRKFRSDPDQIFGSWTDFETFLNDPKHDSPQAQEVKAFYEAFKNAEHKPIPWASNQNRDI